MTMFRALISVCVLAVSAGEVLAQATPAAAPGDPRCWHASQSYSEGSLVRVGGKFYACGTDSRWAEAESGGANCVYEDKNYSSGAMIALKDTLIVCEASGAWTQAKGAAQ
jgi:hypothetical protein